MITNRPRAAARDDTKKTGVERRHSLGFGLHRGGGAIEEKIVGADWKEYGVFQMSSYKIFFHRRYTDGKNNTGNWVKKGRLVTDKENGCQSI